MTAKKAAKSKGGRPSKYDPKFVQQAEKLCALGATDAEMADFFAVSIATLNTWKTRFPEFLAAIKDAKDFADDRVERSFYQRAVGYTYDAVKFHVYKGRVIKTQYREHVPPDVVAGIFWLKNRKNWRDRSHHEVTGKDGEPLVPEASDLDAARRVAFMLANAVKKADAAG